MCSRYGFVNYDRDEFEARFDLFDALFDEQLILPLFNIAPTDLAPVVVERQTHKRSVELMHFGLIPHWAKDPKIAVQCINARAETVAEKPSFRTPFKRKRCLILSDGYYEWKHEGKKKWPYRITRADQKPFAFAGLWDEWTSPRGQLVKTFSIITTETNGLTADFHDRMPVILTRENEPLWLSPDVTEAKTLQPLLKPYPREEMALQPVSTAVNSSKNKDASVLQPPG